jgi:hypothetical protein
LLTSLSRAFSFLLLGSVIVLAICRHPALSFSASQSNRPRQNLHAILSESALAPPLRSPEVTLRFSPNGKYLLFQDPSGVAVLSTSPLAVLFHIAARDIYPVQFSADSQSITIVSRALAFAQWNLTARQRIASGDWTSFPRWPLLCLHFSEIEVHPQRNRHSEKRSGGDAQRLRASPFG